MVEYGLSEEPYDIIYYDEIPVGAAVFTFDSRGTKKDHKGWIHVGYYIGKTTLYEYTVVEAYGAKVGVRYANLLDPRFFHWGYLKGIDYD